MDFGLAYRVRMCYIFRMKALAHTAWKNEEEVTLSENGGRKLTGYITSIDNEGWIIFLTLEGRETFSYLPEVYAIEF